MLLLGYVLCGNRPSAAFDTFPPRKVKRKRGNEGLTVHDCSVCYRCALWKAKRHETPQAKAPDRRFVGRGFSSLGTVKPGRKPR